MLLTSQILSDLLKSCLAKPASWQNAKHTDLKTVQARWLDLGILEDRPTSTLPPRSKLEWRCERLPSCQILWSAIFSSNRFVSNKKLGVLFFLLSLLWLKVLLHTLVLLLWQGVSALFYTIKLSSEGADLCLASQTADNSFTLLPLQSGLWTSRGFTESITGWK